MQFAPLPVAVPLLVAAILVGTGNLLPRRILDLVSILTAGAILVLCLLLVRESADHTIVYWLGNWRPDAHHFPVGICFMIDPLGAGMAALVSLLVMAALTFSWSYFEQVRALYHALMMVFLAAMCGLCLTGDLFNLFVWFELMTATAVGLCGYKSEEKSSLLGALNFAITNTVAAFLTLAGIAMLYALTGSLNMAQVAETMAAHNPGTSFICVAFLFVCTGFLVKAALAPFHFWLADAHAVAPTPVCVLFSGVMVELGVYAVARIYWLVFHPALASHGVAFQNLFLLAGSVTAIVGAVFAFGQRHLKRLLAFSTISHVGLMFIALALLEPAALAGLALYVVGHALVKGTLFICAGILLHRFTTVDEFDLRGRGRKMLPLGLIMFAGALGLAGLPPFATAYGEAFIEKIARARGLGWLTAIAIFAEALTAAAVLRAVARVFLGVGKRHEATSRGAPHIPMESETKGQKNRVPWTMWAPALVLLLLAISIGLAPAVRRAAMDASVRFEDSGRYQAVVLLGREPAAAETSAPEYELDWRRFVGVAAAFAIALAALFPRFCGGKLSSWLGIGIVAIMRPLRTLQSGLVGDYVAWFVFGFALYGGLLLWFARG